MLVEELRQRVLSSLMYEATCRLYNPILGCVAFFFSIEQQIQELREGVVKLQPLSYEKNPK